MLSSRTLKALSADPKYNFRLFVAQIARDGKGSDNDSGWVREVQTSSDWESAHRPHGEVQDQTNAVEVKSWLKSLWK